MRGSIARLPVVRALLVVRTEPAFWVHSVRGLWAGVYRTERCACMKHRFAVLPVPDGDGAAAVAGVLQLVGTGCARAPRGYEVMIR